MSLLSMLREDHLCHDHSMPSLRRPKGVFWKIHGSFQSCLGTPRALDSKVRITVLSVRMWILSTLPRKLPPMMIRQTTSLSSLSRRRRSSTSKRSLTLTQTLEVGEDACGEREDYWKGSWGWKKSTPGCGRARTSMTRRTPLCCFATFGPLL